MSARTCRAKGCSTRISRFHPDDEHCFAHVQLSAVPYTRWPGWVDRAGCVGMDVRRFDVEFPTNGAMTQPIQAAKRICGACPVRRECLRWAFKTEERHFSREEHQDDLVPSGGRYRELVFGGLTGAERMTLAGKRNRVALGLRLLDIQRLHFWLDPLYEEDDGEQVA